MKVHVAIPIIIPAYNPPPLFEKYVSQLRLSIAHPIIIVNDGSTILYNRIFKALSGTPSISIIHHRKNRGKGDALKTGIAYARANWPMSPGYITADADGQHHIDDIRICIREIAKTPQLFIIGARARPQDMPQQNHFGRRTASTFLSMLYGVDIKDTQSGLRYIPQKLAIYIQSSPFHRYDFEMDMIFRAMTLGIPIREFPIRTIYLDGNRHSKFRAFRDTVRVTSVYFYHVQHVFRRFVKR